MAIPSRPTGQDPVSQQLWNISKQMEQLIAQVGAVVKNTTPPTTTTTTTLNLIYDFYNVSVNSFGACNGGVPPTNVGVPNGDMYNATVVFCDFNATSGPNATVYIGFTSSGTSYFKEFLTSSDGLSATATSGNQLC